MSPRPQQTEPEPVVASQPAPVTVTAPPVRMWRVRFAPPSYPGKDPQKPYVASAVILGPLGDKLELGGFVLQRQPDSTISVYMAKAGTLASSPEAIAPARTKAPDGIETDAADGTMPVLGSRQAVEHLRQSIRNAWAACNVGSGSSGPRYGIEFEIPAL